MKHTNSPQCLTIPDLVAEVKGRTDWLETLIHYRDTASLPKSSGSALQDLAKAIQVQLLRGRVGTALAIARVGAFLDSAVFFREVRRTGCFRSSKLGFRSDQLSYLASSLLINTGELSLSEADSRYLKSVANFLRLGPDASKLRLELLRELRKHRMTALKSCMVYVDRRFRPAANDYQTEADMLAEFCGAPDYFSREKHAEALSLLTTLMHDAVGLDVRMTFNIDEGAIREGLCEQLLLAANRLNELSEAEILLDCFPYRAVNVDGGVLVEAVDDRLEQSVRLGYIQTDQQKQVRHRAERDAEYWIGLLDHAKDIYRQLGSLLVKRKREPVDRYVMKVPLLPAFLDLINDERYFREEYGYLRSMAIDAFNSPEWLEDAEVTPGITVRDLMKVQRLFTFWATFFFEALDQPDADGNALDMRSRLPVFSAEDIQRVLVTLFSEEQAKRLFELLSYDPAKGGYFDLQYTPLLRVGSKYLLPMGVLSTSDLVRGVLYRERNRLLPADSSDPMQMALAKALTDRSFLVATGVLRKVNGSHLEVDLLAMRDGHLIIFECKNAFHPCSPQEMRTSYDHILKGGKQLSRASNWLKDPLALERLLISLGWPGRTVCSIQTCIVTANRLFNGYSVEGHPVRQAHEMLNFLKDGKIVITSGEYLLWRCADFDIFDLTSYLSCAGYLQDIFGCMEEAISNHPLGGKLELRFKTFGLNPLMLENIMGSRYVRIGSTVVP